MNRLLFLIMTSASLMCSALPAHADSGLYIGVGAGGATVEADLGPAAFPGLPSSFDEDDTATKLFVGYNFDLPAIDLAIEGGYVDFGEPEIDLNVGPLLVETSGFNLWGIAALDAGLVDIYGKLGLLAWDVDAAFQGSSISDDGSDLGYGAGLRFNVGSLQIRGEYEVYDLGDTDLSMLSVGIAWQFD